MDNKTVDMNSQIVSKHFVRIRELSSFHFKFSKILISVISLAQSGQTVVHINYLLLHNYLIN